MLLAVLSSGPHLYEWEMEFTCIISQHLGLAAPYLLLVHTFFRVGWYIWMWEGWEFSLCVSALTKTSRIPGVPKSLLLFIILFPSPLHRCLIPSRSSPPSLDHHGHCNVPEPMRRLLFALLQNKCMRLAVVFIHLMSDWCIACPLSQIQEGISLPWGN